MPPPRSLPHRDGRLGSASLLGSGSREHYYTNNEIELIHQIVLKAEDILPSLPERDRLPTNALFRAVELVLPEHGYDADNVPAPISRLIFKIGGLRGDGRLMDKFRTILGKMGIELEFVQDDVAADAADNGNAEDGDDEEEARSDDRSLPPLPRPASPRSSLGSVDQTGTFPISSHVQGRRRRNSDGSGPLAGSDDEYVPAAHGRARSSSFGAAFQPAEEVLETTEGRDVDPVVSDIWQQLDRRRHAAQAHVRQSVEDELPQEHFFLPRLLKEPPAQIEGGKYTSGLPIRGARQHSEIPDSYDLEGSPSTAAETENVPPSQHSEAESGVLFRGASDTTVQSLDEQQELLLSRSTEALLQKRLQLYQEHMRIHRPADYLKAWREEAQFFEEDRLVKESRADQYDAECVVPEVLEIWDENALISAHYRFETEAAAETEAQNAQKERYAARAYDLFIIHKAFTHWAACAEEEAQRTAVARRHILRKRIFTAWHGYHAEQEARAVAFTVTNAVRLWLAAATSAQEARCLAVQRYESAVVESAFGRWLDEYKSRVAEELAQRWAQELFLAEWVEAVHHQQSMQDTCNRNLRDFVAFQALSKWSNEAEAKDAVASNGMRYVDASECKAIFVNWAKQATLSHLLRETQERWDTDLSARALDSWSAQTTQVVEQHDAAQQIFMQDYMKTWMYEMELARLVQKQEEEDAAEAMYFWYLTEKLAFFERYAAEKTASHALNCLLEATNPLETADEEALRKAESIDLHNTLPSILSAWSVQAEQNAWLKSHAAGLAVHGTVNECLESWLDYLDDMADWPQWAERGAFFCAVSDTLSCWPRAAKAAKEERLTRTYHAFRQRFKSDMATDFLLDWRAAAEDAMVSSWEAEQIQTSRQEESVVETFSFWDKYARHQEVCMTIAREADLEVALGTWTAAADKQAEMALDAVDYDTGQTVNRCWENWELSALQLRGREYTVADVLAKNDRKLGRQALATWAQHALPDGPVQDDFPSSGVFFRRSGRQSSSVAATPRPLGTPMPHSSSAIWDDELPSLWSTARSARPAPQHLSKIAEQGEMPEDSILGAPAAVVYNFNALTPEESSAPPSPSLDDDDDERPTFSRHRSTEPILRHASTSQLPPEAALGSSFALDDAGQRGPALMSTPTKWTGIVRTLSGYRQTTTPLAPLPSPYERMLRDGYAGDRDALPALPSRGRASVRQTPRVTFEDIAEETEGL